MPLATITYTLKPNIYDNKQRSWDPDGTYQEAPELPTLVPQTGIGFDQITTNSARVTWSLSETQHTSQEIQQWIDGQSTSWTSHPPSSGTVLGPSIRSADLTGLPDNTTIKIRMRTVYED